MGRGWCFCRAVNVDVISKISGSSTVMFTVTTSFICQWVALVSMSVPHPALPSYTDARQLDIRAISHTFALAFQRPQATQKQGNKNVMNLTLYKLKAMPHNIVWMRHSLRQLMCVSRKRIGQVLFHVAWDAAAQLPVTKQTTVIVGSQNGHSC